MEDTEASLKQGQAIGREGWDGCTMSHAPDVLKGQVLGFMMGFLTLFTFMTQGTGNSHSECDSLSTRPSRHWPL